MHFNRSKFSDVGTAGKMMVLTVAIHAMLTLSVACILCSMDYVWRDEQVLHPRLAPGTHAPSKRLTSRLLNLCFVEISERYQKFRNEYLKYLLDQPGQTNAACDNVP